MISPPRRRDAENLKGFPRRLGVSAVIFLFWVSAALAQTDPAAQKLCAEANGIAKELTQISGMTLHHPVPCDFISKEKINEFLKKRVKEAAKPEEIRAEELTLEKFGLVPAGFDLAGSTVDLLTEQAAAFYDYDRKKLFITETTSADSQEPVLAHELSHALADQNYNLAKFIRQGKKSDDGGTARLAVMEGQATWLMSEYLARKNGQTLKDSPSLVAMMSNMSENAAGQYPVFDNSPLYERATLLFPYTKGMLFQNGVFQRDGEGGFGEVFRKPPLSTQQILHPDKYFTGVEPTNPALPDVKLRGYKGLVGGSLGELEHGILLEQYLGKERAATLTPHWRGCNFELRENKKADRVVLLYAAEWESAESAQQYFAAYREILSKKWKKMTVETDTPDAVTGTGDDGRFELRRTGAIVTSVEGLPAGES
jgi:hypothetical protein